MNAAATIITNDFVHYALALRESLFNFNKEIVFYILVTEENLNLKEEIEAKYPNTKILFCDELCKEGIGRKIHDKYFNNYKDEFRWSMKPVVLKYLLKNLNVSKALYLDCDLFFFNSFDFLFEKLDSSRVILTPHWRSMDPYEDPFNFQTLLNDGLYNAGFVGANSNAIEIMNWWAMACEYQCLKRPELGFFNDQAYLNVLPVKFDKVEILNHKGCNIASWNQLECKRTIGENGQVLISEKFPIIFIHFTDGTIKEILMKKDMLLIPNLNQYSKVVKKYDPDLDLILNQQLKINGSFEKKESGKLTNKLKRWFR